MCWSQPGSPLLHQAALQPEEGRERFSPSQRRPVDQGAGLGEGFYESQDKQMRFALNSFGRQGYASRSTGVEAWTLGPELSPDMKVLSDLQQVLCPF